VTINDLNSSASILKKSKEVNSSKQEKDPEAGLLKKAKGRKGKDPVDNSDVKSQTSCDDARKCLGVHLADRN